MCQTFCLGEKGRKRAIVHGRGESPAIVGGCGKWMYFPLKRRGSILFSQQAPADDVREVSDVEGRKEACSEENPPRKDQKRRTINSEKGEGSKSLEKIERARSGRFACPESGCVPEKGKISLLRQGKRRATGARADLARNRFYNRQRRKKNTHPGGAQKPLS